MQGKTSLQVGNGSSKQILVRKMKHMGQVDKEIRRNWKNIFKFINHHRPQYNHNPELSPSLSPTPSPQRRVFTECSDSHMERKDSNPKKLTALHYRLKRQRVQQHQRKNEEIFFKKRTSYMQNMVKESRQEQVSEEKGACGLTVGLPKRHSLQLCKKSEDTVPFMLKRRTAKLEKEMQIIKHGYEDSLLKIKHRDQLKYSLNLQDRQGLINRIKGSRVYYQLLKEWRSDQQDTI